MAENRHANYSAAEIRSSGVQESQYSLVFGIAANLLPNPTTSGCSRRQASSSNIARLPEARQIIYDDDA